MDRKDEFIEKVLFELSGGDLTADLLDRYQPPIIIPIIGQVMDTLLRNAYRQSSSQRGYKDSEMLDSFSKGYPNNKVTSVPVEYDEIRKQHYSVLPVKVVDLMYNDGIRVISDLHNQSNQFAPMPANAQMFYSELHDGPSAFNQYKLEGNKIYYTFKFHDKAEVFMLLVPTFDDLEDEDIIGSPELISKDGLIGVSEEIKKKLMTMPPTKASEDGTTKQV